MRPPGCWPSSAPPTSSTATSPAASTRPPNLGKVLDPVADRLLFFVGGGGILIDGSMPTWFAVAVLAREVLVSGATVVAGRASGPDGSTCTWFGKAGTWGLMMAFPLFLARERPRWQWWQGGGRGSPGSPAWPCTWYAAAPLRADGPDCPA